MITAISIIFVFGLLVLVHELGHFLVAKRAGIKILEFAFGIGPKIAGIKGKETLYSIRLFPLGGFVRFLSAEEIEEEDQVTRRELLSRSFESKSVLQRMSVIVAGPIMNFVLGAILFIVIFAWFGVPIAENIVGSIIPDKPAAAAGLTAGDKILAVNNIDTPDWNAVTQQIHAHPGEKLTLKIEKAETKEVVSIDITPELDEQSGRGIIGITASESVTIKKVTVVESTKYGFQQTVNFTRLIVVILFEGITGKTTLELGGPVAVAEIIGEGAKRGMSDLLSIAGILSIQFGILNLLPIPALDGGQLAVLSYEGIRRKPLNPEKKGWIQLTGFVLLMALMLAVTYQDIVRILTK